MCFCCALIQTVLHSYRERACEFLKTFIGTMLLLVVLIGSIIVYDWILANKEQNFDALAQGLQQAITQQELEEANNYITKMEENWNTTRNMLMAFSEHEDLNNAEERLKNLRSAYVYKDWQEMYKELEVFQMLLKNEFESAKPTLTNIL